MIRKRILLGPEVPDLATLTSVVARLGHYFAHVEVERVVVVLASDLDIDTAAAALVDFAPPPGFDRTVGERVDRIRESVVLLPDTAELRSQVVDCDILLLWESGAIEREPWNEIAKGYRRNRTMFDVDWRTTRGDGIWFAEAATVLEKSCRRFDANEADRFNTRTRALCGADRAYLIATGPSARMALSIDMCDGVRIVCNTAVLDDELMAHVAPDIVTFADPIFHFGPSTYAREFQLALARQAQRHDFTIVTVERFAGLLRSRLPEVADRIVGVRMGGAAWVQNLDLLRELAVRPYPNVLTMLMLPLAATFARDVQLIGFDGRGPDETYFWRHGETVQLDRELDEIKLVHAGFFELDYGDYYISHVNALEQLLRRVEQQGITVSPRSPSFMTPLRRRARSPDLDPLTADRGPPAPAQADVMISITPDWVDRFGHFGPWERRMRRAAGDRGLDFRSLASKALVAEDESELGVFTHGTLSCEPFDTASFEVELRDQLAAFDGSEHRVLVAFYTADVWHLPSMLAVARDHPAMLFAVNLMRAHTRIATARAKEQAPGQAGFDPITRLLSSCLEAADGTNLVVCIDTEAIAAEVNELTGFGIPTWPMISVGDPDKLERAGSASRRHRGVRLVAPIQTQRGKGVSEVLSLAERMHASLQHGRLSLAARFLAQPGASAAGNHEWADRLTELGVELIEGDLTDEEYVQMVGEADVVLLPYRREIFRTRTSAVFLDAVAAGKPVVATRGTWAGDLVEDFAIGATFRDGDADHLLTAVRWTIIHRRALRRRVIHRRHEILERFAPDLLIDFLVAEHAVRRGRRPSEIGVARARSVARTIVGEFWATEHERIQQHITDQVRADDVSRAGDARRDESEPLQRAARWGLTPVAGAKPTTELPVGRAPAAVGLEWCELWREAPTRLDEVQLVERIIPTTRQVVAFERDVRAECPTGPGFGDMASIAHVDLLRIDAAASAMAVLERFPWARLRPSAAVVSFDDRLTAGLGHKVRDLAEQLLARGYQVWISDWHPRVNGNGGPDWQRVCTYVGNPVMVQASGRLIAFLQPVPADVMGTVLTDVLAKAASAAGESGSTVRPIPTTGGWPEVTAVPLRRDSRILQL